MPINLRRVEEVPTQTNLSDAPDPFQDGCVSPDDPELLGQPNGEHYVSPVDPVDPVDQEAIKLANKINMLRSCTPGVLAALYVKKRTERDAAKDVVAGHQAQMEIVKSVIFEKFDELQINSFRPDGDERTCITDSERKSAVVKDRQAFLTFILNQLLSGIDLNALDYLECHGSLKTAEEFQEQNEGELPPGLNINRVRTLSVTVTKGKRLPK